jgi:hypothetical protein
LSEPRFITLGTAQEKLNLASRSTMQNLFPFVPHLYVRQRQTRLFPTSYINQLAEFLDGKSATIGLVRRFNATATTRRLLAEMQSEFAAAIDAKAEHTPTEVAALLGVSRATVSGWIGSRTLAFNEKKLQKGQIVPMGPRQRRVMGRQFITPQSIRDAAEWVMPR